jgi:hypothetical protein
MATTRIDIGFTPEARVKNRFLSDIETDDLNRFAHGNIETLHDDTAAQKASRRSNVIEQAAVVAASLEAREFPGAKIIKILIDTETVRRPFRRATQHPIYGELVAWQLSPRYQLGRDGQIYEASTGSENYHRADLSLSSRSATAATYAELESGLEWLKAHRFS